MAIVIASSSAPGLLGVPYGRTRGCSCACVAGVSAASRRPIDVSSACAVSNVTPGASLPKTLMYGPLLGATFAASVPPQLVADHGDGRRAGPLVGLGEDAPVQRPLLRDAECRGAYLGREHRLRRAVGSDDIGAQVTVRTKIRDRSNRRAPLLEVV